GTTTAPFGLGGTQYHTDYLGGMFFIYAGSPRNAPTAAGGMPPNPPAGGGPGQFIDGTLVLAGTLSGFKTPAVVHRVRAHTGSFRSNYQFTGPVGGPEYAKFAGTGQGLLSNLWCAKGTSPGLCDIPAGYSAHPNGKWDMPPTDVRASTWGAIKQLYR